MSDSARGLFTQPTASFWHGSYGCWRALSNATCQRHGVGGFIVQFTIKARVICSSSSLPYYYFVGPLIPEAATRARGAALLPKYTKGLRQNTPVTGHWRHSEHPPTALLLGADFGCTANRVVPEPTHETLACKANSEKPRSLSNITWIEEAVYSERTGSRSHRRVVGWPKHLLPERRARVF